MTRSSNVPNLINQFFLYSGNTTGTDREQNCTVILTDAPEKETEDIRLNCLLKEILPRWLNELQSCKEDFPKHGRLIFSSITMVIQYLLPTITISVAYLQVTVTSVTYQKMFAPTSPMPRTMSFVKQFQVFLLLK